MENPNFKYLFIPVENIDRMANTRSFTDPEEVKNLAESINSIGLINPISVHQKDDGRYGLVSGSRRLDAFILLGKDQIEAKVYAQLSEDDAFILHCTENLQREDISIEDEVKIIRFMIEAGMTESTISIALGKPIYYVRTRKQLISVIPQLWDKLKLNYLDLRQAAMIARYNDKQQKQIADAITNIITQQQLDKMLDSLSFSLVDVEFINDESLDPKMGACVKCPNNTATYSLFKDEKATCTLPSCFKNKTALWNAGEFSRIAETTQLVATSKTSEWSKEEKLIVKLLTDKIGISIGFINENDFAIIQYPESNPHDLEILLSEGYKFAHAITGRFFNERILIKQFVKEGDTTEAKPVPVADKSKIIESLISDYENKLMALTQTKSKKDMSLLKTFLEEKKYPNEETALSQTEWNIFICSLILKTKRFDLIDMDVNTKVNESKMIEIYEAASKITVDNPKTHYLLRSFIFSHLVDQDNLSKFFLEVADALHADWRIVSKEYQDAFEKKVNAIHQNIAKAKKDLNKEPEVVQAEQLPEPVEYSDEPVVTETVDEAPQYDEVPVTNKREWKADPPELKTETAEDIIKNLYG